MDRQTDLDTRPPSSNSPNTRLRDVVVVATSPTVHTLFTHAKSHLPSSLGFREMCQLEQRRSQFSIEAPMFSQSCSSTKLPILRGPFVNSQSCRHLERDRMASQKAERVILCCCRKKLKCVAPTPSVAAERTSSPSNLSNCLLRY